MGKHPVFGCACHHTEEKKEALLRKVQAKTQTLWFLSAYWLCLAICICNVR